ncbi:MAG: hypothetical protein GX892_08275 [Thermoanaerobacteraceae bacterium]|nr:hypothetical protein [Thermoanaerobacteraceae bacterium]
MKDRDEVVFAGVGGQGLILAGKIFGEAAILEGKNATQTMAYGVASRGGFSKSDVVISKNDIAYPEVLDPDVVVALSQQAYDRYKDIIKEDCLLIYDGSSIKGGESTGQAEAYPIAEKAVELNNMKILNMIALGILARRTNIVSLDSLKASLDKNTPSKFKEVNFKAFEEGYNMEIGK